MANNPVKDLLEVEGKIIRGESLNPEDYEILQEYGIDSNFYEELSSSFAKEDNSLENLNEEDNSYGNQNEKGKVYVKKLPGVAGLFSQEEKNPEENNKSGFTSALLLAIISFISEILFIGLAYLIYKK